MTVIASVGQAGTHPIHTMHSSGAETIIMSPSLKTPIGHVITQILQSIHLSWSSITSGIRFTALHTRSLCQLLKY